MNIHVFCVVIEITDALNIVTTQSQLCSCASSVEWNWNFGQKVRVCILFMCTDLFELVCNLFDKDSRTYGTFVYWTVYSLVTSFSLPFLPLFTSSFPFPFPLPLSQWHTCTQTCEHAFEIWIWDSPLWKWQSCPPLCKTRVELLRVLSLSIKKWGFIPGIFDIWPQDMEVKDWEC